MKSRTMFTLLMAATLFFANQAAHAAGPKVGDAAPDFSLPDQNGQTHKLSDFRGKWLVLYFYVKDDTPGCTEQACKFRDDIYQLDGLGAQIVGVSVDNTASHADFAKKYSLPFPLLADSKGQIAARYGSLRGDGSLAKRNTFVIDPQGKIARIYLSASTSRNSAEVVEDLKKLKGRQKRSS
jgi:thioredoxin-dependent peroxiredoxin